MMKITFLMLLLSMINTLSLGNVIQDMIDQGKASGNKYIRIPVSFLCDLFV